MLPEPSSSGTIGMMAGESSKGKMFIAQCEHSILFLCFYILGKDLEFEFRTDQCILWKRFHSFIFEQVTGYFIWEFTLKTIDLIS